MDVGDDIMPVTNGNIAQRCDFEERRLVVNKLAIQRSVLADSHVTEVEVLAVAAVCRRHTVARVRRVGEISTSGCVETWLTPDLR